MHGAKLGSHHLLDDLPMCPRKYVGGAVEDAAGMGKQGVMLFRTGAAQEIAARQHADERSRNVDDGQAAHFEICHKLDGLAERGLGVNAGQARPS